MQCKVKIIIENEEKFGLGPGVIRLFKEIDKIGQVSVAAKNLEISYSKAWKMIHTAEEGMGTLLVERAAGGRQGGNAHLTEKAKEYIAAFEKTQKEIEDYAQKVTLENFSLS